MKNVLRSILVFAVIFSAGNIYGQLKEGVIKYKIEMDSDDPNMKAQLSMMANSTMTMYFLGDKFRQEMDMGGMSKNTTIMDNKKKKGLMLIEVPMMGMKSAAPLEMDDKEEEEEEEESDVDVEILDEEKEIAGHNCKKAIVTDSEGNEMIMFFTEDIKPIKGSKYGADGQINGFPLYIETENQGMTMIMTATEVSDEIEDDSIFSLEIPEGYDETTVEELQNMGG